MKKQLVLGFIIGLLAAGSIEKLQGSSIEKWGCRFFGTPSQNELRQKTQKSYECIFGCASALSSKTNKTKCKSCNKLLKIESNY